MKDFVHVDTSSVAHKPMIFLENIGYFMSKKCELTGKKPIKGHNVSHANNKSRRRFNINLQRKKFWLPDENRFITLKLSTRGMRIIDKKGISKVFKDLKAKGIKI